MSTLEGLVERCWHGAPSAAELEAARLRVFDATLSIRLGSTLAEWPPAACALARLLGPVTTRASNAPGGTSSDEAGRAGRASTGLRAAALAACCRLTEVDDIHLASCTTPGSVAVPVALALAASGVPEGAALAGVVTAYEAVVAAASLLGGAFALAAGVWPTRAVAPVAAALGAARGLELSAEQALDAAALGASHAAAGRHPDPGRALSLALAVLAGLGAAFAASAGVRADRSTLRDWEVFVHATAAGQSRGNGRPPAPLEEDGRDRPAVLDTCVKPFPAARQVLAATALVRSRVEGGRLRGHDAAAVRVGVPSAHQAMVDRLQVRSRLDTLASMQLQLSLALEDPACLDELEHPLPDAGLAARMARVSVEADPALDEAFPHRWGARVTIAAGNNEESYATEGVPGERDLSWRALEAKHLRLVTALPRGGTAGRGGGAATAAGAASTIAALRTEIEDDRLFDVAGELEDCLAGAGGGR